MKIEERVGIRIREAREAKGWSQKVLGERLEIWLGRKWSPQTVHVAERGGRDFAIREMVALSDVLQRPISWFLKPPMADLDDPVEMPANRVRIGETTMRHVYGVPRSDTPGLAKQLREIARLVEAIEGDAE